mmetsp:Transcript_41030/g.80958  ORF Transcript_41030/g.80958 Transcript_41030/m.80958 type:complete len:114 (-) Transcript_41030:395-736(-)
MIVKLDGDSSCVCSSRPIQLQIGLSACLSVCMKTWLHFMSEHAVAALGQLGEERTLERERERSESEPQHDERTNVRAKERKREKTGSPRDSRQRRKTKHREADKLQDQSKQMG